MKFEKFLQNLAWILFLLPLFCWAETPQNLAGIAVFTPPKDWKVADKEVLPPHVKTLVVGPKLQSEMPPTMNLMIEPYQGDLKSYLKNVKKINDLHGDSWKDLGSLKTKAGEASLSQVEIRSKWGGEKLMHAIIVRNGYAYVLTATASKNEFGRFYQAFYNALRSLQIYNQAFEIVTNPQQRKNLEQSFTTIKDGFIREQTSTGLEREQVFQSEKFQNQYWMPFETTLKQDYANLGDEWQIAILEDLKESLLTNK